MTEYLSGVTLTAAVINGPIIQSGLLSTFLSLTYCTGLYWRFLVWYNLRAGRSNVKVASLIKVQLQICAITNLWVAIPSSKLVLMLCPWSSTVHIRNLQQYSKGTLTSWPWPSTFYWCNCLIFWQMQYYQLMDSHTHFTVSMLMSHNNYDLKKWNGQMSRMIERCKCDNAGRSTYYVVHKGHKLVSLALSASKSPDTIILAYYSIMASNENSLQTYAT